jgi:hypothetical protein
VTSAQTPPAQRAVEVAGELVEDLAGELLSIPDNEFREMLGRLELPAVVMLASMKVRAHQVQRHDAIETALGRRSPEPVDRQKLSGNASQVDADRLVHGYVLVHATIPTRARYNLACYFTELATHSAEGTDKNELFDHALLQLDYALEEGSLVSWAENDPSLEALRSARKGEFAETIERHSDAAATTPLPRKRPSAEMRGQMRRRFVDWLEADQGVGGRVLRVAENFEAAILRSQKADVLIDASAAREPDPEAIEVFVDASRDWPGRQPDRVFLVRPTANLTAAFLRRAAERRVDVYVVGESVDRVQVP